MKVKVVGLMVLLLHVMVLGGFLLTQGCATRSGRRTWTGRPASPAPVSPADDFATPLPPPLPADRLPQMAAPARPAVSRPLPPSQTYTVQKGDTLSSIAAAHGTTWRALADFNLMDDPNRLRVGQQIRIPSSIAAPRAPATAATAATAPAAVSSTAPISQGTVYAIQRGDTLGEISKRSGVSVAEIMAANSLTNDRIQAGSSLTIPRKGTVKTPPPAAPAVAPAARPAAPAAAPAAAPVAPAPAVASVSAPVPAPAPAVPAPESPVPAATPAAAPVYEHVLYPGETIEDVARQYGSTQGEIMKLNNITDPSSIRPGTKLLVPIPE